jgi:tocopherol O-methyltransferase
MGTEADYRELMSAAGFQVEAGADVSRQVRGTWGVCARRAAVKLVTDRQARAYLFSAASRNREFLLTIGRIWLAYRVGAMRYLVWRARKPG